MYIPTQERRHTPPLGKAALAGHFSKPSHCACCWGLGSLGRRSIGHTELSSGGGHGDCEKLACPHWKCQQQMTQVFSPELGEGSRTPQVVQLLSQ